jgi:SAM-dependent methyltransferase
MMSKENYFDTEIEEYEEWFKRNDQLLNSELDAIRQLLPDTEGGIEIGVGTGIFASKLRIEHGVEPSEKMAAVAQKRGIHVIKASAEEIPVNDGLYHFVLMVTVDCFLDDVSKAFSEARRILVDDGFLIIAFLDKATPLGMMYEKNKHLHESYKNANFHSAIEVSKLLEDAGFSLEERNQTIFSLDNQPQEIKSGNGEGLFAVIKAKKL